MQLTPSGKNFYSIKGEGFLSVVSEQRDGKMKE